MDCMLMTKTCNKIAKLNSILLRQNISKLDCDMQVYIHYTKSRLNVLWTQKHGLSSKGCSLRLWFVVLRQVHSHSQSE
jgi:hypothetical protein